MIVTLDVNEAKRRARRGATLLMLRRVAIVMMTLISTVTIARLVPPEAYGLANMSSVLLGLALVFRDFGLTNAMMRKADIDSAELSFIFWLNVAMTALLTIALAALAPMAADFYHEPVMLWVILVSLVGFFAAGVTQQHVTLMNRNLRFGAVAMIEVAALIVGFTTTLILALIRHDFWAIVVGQAAQLLASATLFVVFSDWRPGRPTRPKEFGSLLVFGANASIFSLSTFLSNNVIVIVIGHFLGAGQVGQYNRAQAVFQLPAQNFVQPIVQATIPLLTQLSPHPEEYRAAYLRLQRQLSVTLIPMAVALSFAAVPLIETLLGPRWNVAGLVLTALAPTLGAYVFGYAAHDLFLTQDRSAELRTIGLIELVIRAGLVSVTIRYGIVAVAIGYTISTYAAVLLRLIVAGRTGPISRLDQLRAGAPGIPLGIGALALCVCAALIVPLASPSPLRAAILLGSGGCGALAIGLMFNASRQALNEVLDAVGIIRIYSALQRRLRTEPIDTSGAY